MDTFGHRVLFMLIKYNVNVRNRLWKHAAADVLEEG